MNEEMIEKSNRKETIGAIHPKHMEEYGLPAALTELAHGNAVYAICLDDKGKIINIDPLADLTIGEVLDGYRFIVDKEL